MKRLIFLMSLFYLIQIYGGNPGIYDLAFGLYLKETLGLSAERIAYIGTIILLPWTIKPAWGIIADSFPLFGSQLRNYFFLCYALAATVLFTLSSMESYTTLTLIGGIFMVSLCIAFSDVLTDKMMVIEGSARKKTGVLQAAQWTAAGLGGAGMYYLGGIFAKRSNLGAVFRLNVLVPLTGLLATYFFIREEKANQNEISLRKSSKALWTAARSKQFLAVVVFIAFFRFSPTPPLLFYLRDVLKFDPEFMGTLDAIGSVASGIGAAVFGIVCSRIYRRTLLNMTIGLSALSSFGLIFMQDAQSAVWVYSLTGFFSMIATLGILELAARLCPAGAEGTAYALLVSIYNLAGKPAAIIGARMYDNGVPFAALVIIGSIFTLLCWFLIPLLKLEKE
ncbi:MAG: arabinose efflux permease family protein [Parcubacteria group bacterium GW2011_GWA2_45_30]|nr:MAG: arabinose efflux permease family protein [Parcubacteria group bacterium GW2011_GWA2_45_30]